MTLTQALPRERFETRMQRRVRARHGPGSALQHPVHDRRTAPDLEERP